MRLRLLLIACALVFLASAGLHPIDEHSIEPFGTAASSQVSAKPTPRPSLPAVGPDAAPAAPTAPAPLTSGWHRHLRPIDTAALFDRPASRAALGAARPLTFPLLI